MSVSLRNILLRRRNDQISVRSWLLEAADDMVSGQSYCCAASHVASQVLGKNAYAMSCMHASHITLQDAVWCAGWFDGKQTVTQRVSPFITAVHRESWLPGMHAAPPALKYSYTGGAECDTTDALGEPTHILRCDTHLRSIMSSASLKRSPCVVQSASASPSRLNELCAVYAMLQPVMLC